MRRRQVHQRNVLGRLVRQQRLLRGLFPVPAGLELRQIPVIVPLHLQVEHLGLPAGRRRDQVLVQKAQDAIADILQLLLDHLSVLLNPRNMLLVPFGLLFLLDARDDPPRCATRPDDVLVCHAQQVALLHRQLLLRHHLRHLFHLGDLHTAWAVCAVWACRVSERVAERARSKLSLVAENLRREIDGQPTRKSRPNPTESSKWPPGIVSRPNRRRTRA